MNDHKSVGGDRSDDGTTEKSCKTATSTAKKEKKKSDKTLTTATLGVSTQMEQDSESMGK